MSTLMWITEKKLDWEIKNKGDQVRWNWENYEIFIPAVRKWEMLAATEVKIVINGSEKKKREQEHIRQMLHKTRY